MRGSSCHTIDGGARRPMFAVLAATALFGTSAPSTGIANFIVEEATIDDIHRAIKSGEITCQGVVQAYIDRAKAYNGVCTALVTADGGPVPAATGTCAPARRSSFRRRPSRPRPCSRSRPVHRPAARSRPDGTDRLRPERAAAVRHGHRHPERRAAERVRDAEHPRRALGHLQGRVRCASGNSAAAGAPAACEEFRQQPDALERAAELDAQYGRNPGSREDADVLRHDHGQELVRREGHALDRRQRRHLRDGRAAARHDARRAAARQGRDHLRRHDRVARSISTRTATSSRRRRSSAATRSAAAGAASPATPTIRSARPAAAAAAPAHRSRRISRPAPSARPPAARAAFPRTPTPSRASSPPRASPPKSGSATADFINHRPGVLCRTLGDAARVIDAMKNPEDGYFDPRDFFTAQPRALDSGRAVRELHRRERAADAKPLAGLRVGIVREFMVKHTPNDAAISDRVDAEFKAMLRDRLGAELVESVDPLIPTTRSAEHEVHVRRRVLGDPARQRARVFLPDDRGWRARVRRAWLRRDVARLPGQARRCARRRCRRS